MWIYFTQHRKSGTVALTRVVRHGDRDLVDFLLAHGADIHTQNNSGQGIITAAVRTSNPRMVEHLLARGAKINMQDEVGAVSDKTAPSNDSRLDVCAEQDGETAVMHAIRSGRVGMVAYLAEKGADMNIKNKVRNMRWQPRVSLSCLWFMCAGRARCIHNRQS